MEPKSSVLEDERSRRPLLLLGVVALVLLGVLALGAFRRSVVYYLSPTEVLTQQGHSVRVSGTVVRDSIALSPERGSVSFRVTDGKTVVPVEYIGPAPDTLKDDAEAVAEGELGSDGTFHANKLFAKCPSKFEGKKKSGG